MLLFPVNESLGCFRGVQPEEQPTALVSKIAGEANEEGVGADSVLKLGNQGVQSPAPLSTISIWRSDYAVADVATRRDAISGGE